MRIGLQLSGSRGKLAAAIACLIEHLTSRAKSFFNLCQPRPKLLGFELEQSLSYLGCVSFGLERDNLLGELDVLGLALLLFCQEES